MTHLILCREFPPAPYPAGGIGTYARHIARLLAESGETVHVIGQRWQGAPDSVVESSDGRLIVHRISVEESIASTPEEEIEQSQILKQLAASTCPTQLFSWQAARYIEALLERETIDVIEAQEWEAPLYYFLVRRAAGLGPKQQPPCIVHLHSPTQMIFEYNEWDTTLTDFLPLARMEEYTIRAADMLLCPSRYLAQQVVDRYDLGGDRVEVIPYAMGIETPVLERAPKVWARNTMCYVGRLELRKGIVEWIDAAVRVAAVDASVDFDFFGADTYLGGVAGRSVLAFLKGRIPRSLRDRFRFHGAKSRAQLMTALADVAIAVVPSRWENFPFTCIEAMSTGLPVLASPHGGMAEMVTDGESGWITDDSSIEGLEAGLLRALATPPWEREAMGKRAAETIRRICGNGGIVARQIALRKRVTEVGAIRSLRVAGVNPTGGRPDRGRQAMGLIVTCMDNPKSLPACLNSIAMQTTAPKTIVVVHEGLRQHTEGVIHSARMNVIYTSEMSSRQAQHLGLQSLLTNEPELRSVTQIVQDVRLKANYVEACEHVFEHQPDIGLVSPWILRDGKRPDLDAGPVPMSFESMEDKELPPYSAIRTEILEATTHPTWNTFTAGNGTALTYPGPLLSVAPPNGRSRHTAPKRRYSGMSLIVSQSLQFTLQWFRSAPLPDKVRWLTRTALQPRQAIARLKLLIGSRLRKRQTGPER